MLATSKNVLHVYPGHTHLPTTTTDDPSLLNYHPHWCSGDRYQWLAGGYDPDTGHF